MTLPEHLICSLAIAQLGVARQMGTKGIVLVALAGISPDLDSAAKLVGEKYFWSLHHALGHCLLAIFIIAVVYTLVGWRWIRTPPGQRNHYWRIFVCCLLAAFVHCLTDSLYWWGVKPFWPFDGREITFNILEYLDLFVLAIWILPCIIAWRCPAQATRMSWAALTLFTCYVGTRIALPDPTGNWQLLTGGWIYAAPNDTPILDWW